MSTTTRLQYDIISGDKHTRAWIHKYHRFLGEFQEEKFIEITEISIVVASETTQSITRQNQQNDLRAERRLRSAWNIGSFPYRRVRLTFGVSPIALETFYRRGKSNVIFTTVMAQIGGCILTILIRVFPVRLNFWSLSSHSVSTKTRKAD